MTLTIPKTCSMGSSQTGLVGTIGVTLLNPDGTTHTARATASIYEIGGGCYGKQIGFDDDWIGSIKWDTGGGTPVYASEEYIYYENNPKVDTILTDTNELQTNQGNWLTAVGFSTHTATDIWSVVTRSLTDKSGFSLSTAGIKAIWDQLTSALTTIGSLGKLLVDNLNATITSRSPVNEYDTEMAHLDVDVSSRNNVTPNIVIPDVAGTAATLHGITDGKIDVMDVIVDAIKVKTDNLPSGITKNEALSKFSFLMVLSSDHVTAATGKTITGEISKNGGAFTAITNTIIEVSNGMYTIADGFTQEEMNADIVALKFDGNDCDTSTIIFVTT